MTAAQIRAWLRSNAPDRVVLVEVDYMYQVGVGGSAVPTKGTLYFATKPYIDQSVPRKYDDCILAVPEYKRELNRATLSGQYTVTIGTLELDNADGDLDYVLGLAIDGSQVRVYLGAMTWAITDFIRMFVAYSVLAQADSTQDRLSIVLRDTSLLLNKSIGGTIAVGGTGPSANQFRALNFGWVHQLQPPSVDSTLLKYAHSDRGTNTAALFVRSNGVDLGGSGFTDNGDGTFTLAANPSGATITCDVLAHGAAAATAYRLSDAIAFFIGGEAGLTALGLYGGAQATFGTGGPTQANNYHVGASYAVKTNCITLLGDLMNTMNGFWAVDRNGMFYYGWMRPEAISAIISEASLSGLSLPISGALTEDDIFDNTLKVAHSAPTFSGYQALANINVANQSVFATSLTAAQIRQFTRPGYFTAGFFGEEPSSTQYLGSTASFQGGAPQLYHLSESASAQTPTLISCASDSAIPDPVTGLSINDYLTNWSSVRRSQFLPWTEFLDFETGLDNYDLELGNIVNMTHSRFGLSSGALHQVCTIDMQLMPNDTTVPRIVLGIVRRRFAGVSGPLASVELREDGGIELREDGGKELRE